MKIVKEYPPNIAKIRKAFPGIINHKPVFTYGDTLYNPQNGDISRDLLVHEKVHVKQQGSNPEGWWDKYIASKEFRLTQEIKAYRQQFLAYSGSLGYLNMVKRIAVRKAFLESIARDLSSDLYGKIVSFEVAKDLIGKGL